MENPGSLATAFRDVMSQVCTPVSVVTAMDGERPHGTTVSAFASLSVEPPMVLVALDRTSDLLALVRSSGHFGVNVLGSAQPEIAKRFARKGNEKFSGVPWQLEHGSPRLEGTCGWLACAVTRLVDGGDHVVALSAVLSAERSATPPLTYHARQFGTHAPLDGRVR